MVALHDLHWNYFISRQMICKQHIVLNYVFFWYESNLKIRTRYKNKHFFRMVMGKSQYSL